MILREGTFDEYIWDSVIRRNEYKLPPRLDEKIILDIGAHIGSFSYACYLRGARQIYAYEALPENYDVLKENMKDTTVQCFSKAVWRSDTIYTHVYHTGYPDMFNGLVNTGGGNVLWADNPYIRVPAIALDDILLELKEVHLMKIDCESAEFPIILTSKEISRVHAITGEYHEINGEFDQNKIPLHAQIEGYSSFTVEALGEYLTRLGFYFTFQGHLGSHIGKFRAVKV